MVPTQTREFEPEPETARESEDDPQPPADTDTPVTGDDEIDYRHYEWDEDLGEYVLTEESSLTDGRLVESQNFVLAQQLPVDDSLWAAVTDEQKDLVAYIRDHNATIGKPFTEHDEDLVIFLAVEACLSAIEAGHSVDVEIFKNHMAGSAQIQHVIESATENRALVEQNIASTFTVGMGFLCVDDYEPWRAIYEEIYE